MRKFIGENLSYPAMERDNDIQGKVVVGFVVWEDGSIRDVEIKKSLSAGCDKEAVRVIKAMPKWKAGKQQGKSVPVKYVLPIAFKLQ